MFSANAQLEVLAGSAAAFGGNGHELAYAVGVKADEGIAFENSLSLIGRD